MHFLGLMAMKSIKAQTRSLGVYAAVAFVPARFSVTWIKETRTQVPLRTFSWPLLLMGTYWSVVRNNLTNE